MRSWHAPPWMKDVCISTTTRLLVTGFKTTGNVALDQNLAIYGCAMKNLPARRIGQTELEVSVLGLGGAPLGDLYERIPEERAVATLEIAYQRGIRFFDTAPLYGHGLSEHRLGHVLRSKPRADLVVSTKVGRWLRPERGELVDRGQFAGGLNFQTVYDYSYDGTMRALEQSYHRLGMDRVDIALIHDVDIWTHGSAEAYERRFREAMDGAYRALDELRRSGVVRVIGVGINEVAPCVRFAKEAAFDCFLLAGRYTLLEQNGLDDLSPLAEQHGFSLLLGGPFNSGILATGATPGAKYNYKPAPPAIIKQVARIEAVCKRHDVPLAAAAIQFPLGQPTIASIVTGAVSPFEVERNAAYVDMQIPRSLWDELKAEKLLAADAPVPVIRAARTGA
jgi:D-threo-aldose 1-dehydrogenase